MSLDAIMDAVAVRAAAGLSGLKACYSAGSSVEGADIMPNNIDDWPIGVVLFMGDDAEAGNFESIVIDLDLVIWVNAQDFGYAYKTIIPYRDRGRVLFRTDIDANGTAVRVLWKGTSAVEVDDAHGAPFLTMSLHLEALEIYASTDYAV